MIYTNGVEITQWRMDGESDWTKRMLVFAGGENTVKWCYYKDEKVFGVEGAGSLDESEFKEENVDIEFGKPEGGKVKIKATPKDPIAKQFFEAIAERFILLFTFNLHLSWQQLHRLYRFRIEKKCL